MNLRQIEIFCAVMRCRTTIAAAHELGLSQPAVSNAIKHLEAHIGVALFDRLGNRLVPTQAATTIYRDTQPLQLMAQSIRRKVMGLKNATSGEIRIVSTPPLGETILPGVIAEFLRDRGDVRVFFDVQAMGGVVEAVESGAADFGVGLFLGTRPSLALQPITKGTMVAVLPLGHPLAGKAAITPADLVGVTLIGLEPVNVMAALVIEAFSAAGVPYEPQVTVIKGATAAMLVEEGVGVAIIDSLSARKGADRAYVVRPFLPAVTLNACVITVKDKPLSQLAKRFVDRLKVRARGMAAG